MQISGYHFQPRLIPALAVMALLALFVHLGLWQAGKAELGQVQRALYDARGKQAPLPIGSALLNTNGMHFAPVVVRGEYDAAHQFYLDNQVVDGRPGVHVMTPLKIEGGNTRVLVNRGWAPWENRRIAPHVSTPDGLQQVMGIAVIPVKSTYLLMPDRPEPWPELKHMLDMSGFIEDSGYPVQPVILYEASKGQDDGLIRQLPRPEDRIAMHNGYAIQWFGMAIALVGFYLAVSFRKKA